MTETLHQRGVRVVMQTLSPRKGYPEAEYTPQMEELRLQINDWIAAAGCLTICSTRTLWCGIRQAGLL